MKKFIPLMLAWTLLSAHEDPATHFPILRNYTPPSKYERILLTSLRDVNTPTETFKIMSKRLGQILVAKVVECLPTRNIDIETPVAPCQGEVLENHVEFVSIMRSGDALLETFVNHFPAAHISKFLIQRDEVTALPIYKYMKVSPTLSSGNSIIITEPMIATGGTLDMVITLLKELGIQEKNIIVASVIAAPEGLKRLSDKDPDITVVVSMLDEALNDQRFMVPGLGDFGDRYYGTLGDVGDHESH